MRHSRLLARGGGRLILLALRVLLILLILLPLRVLLIRLATLILLAALVRLRLLLLQRRLDGGRFRLLRVRLGVWRLIRVLRRGRVGTRILIRACILAARRVLRVRIAARLSRLIRLRIAA